LVKEKEGEKKVSHVNAFLKKRNLNPALCPTQKQRCKV